MKIGRYIIGLVSGLTFGMLFAPKKGKALRDSIIKKSSESGTEGLKELGNAFLEAGGEAWDEIKNLSE
ncbi:YtxH domain-containing protein, partial [Patescibacteria group bacterium]|nr:YtxH domain-containing protein [Patescibacteria group bacterium]